jgi:superfamily I DNA and/or RNA helicase
MRQGGQLYPSCLSHIKGQKVVLIGDHFQLPPSIAPLLQTDEANEELPFLEACFVETSFLKPLQ